MARLRCNHAYNLQSLILLSLVLHVFYSDTSDIKINFSIRELKGLFKSFLDSNFQS